jgi:UMF1 family MFS transporter
MQVNDVNIFFLFIVGFAFFGSLVVGHLGDKWGHWRMLLVVMSIWVVGLGIGVVVKSKEMFYVVGALLAIGLGGIWTVSRSFLMGVCHPEEKSQMFALYGLVYKGAAVIGPLIWGRTEKIFAGSPELKYRMALLSMGVLMVIGLAVMTRVRLEPKPLEVFPERR